MAVMLETSLGDIVIDLMTVERPRCCLNFIKLCKIKYYNFAMFHSVQRNLVAQTGDPTYTGKGGESIFAHLYGEQAKYFEAETKPRIKHKSRGTVSMVNNGNNQHGSQFFITLADDLDYLDGIHTVFGDIAEGFEILEKMNETHTDSNHRPYVDIRIYHTIILNDPFEDPAALEIPDRSPERTKAQLASVRIAPDEELDDAKGKTGIELEEMQKKKESNANAMLLEMIGDLPDQNVKPPDNVLFVCKLNPVTTQEDLEIIFSRFGTIECCEVIKDQKSEESLQYAFIEFESPDSCEKAYFKMDNVLIDDRRIHVDFSQSVSKVKWKGKGKGVEIFDERKTKTVSRSQNREDSRSEPKSKHPNLIDRPNKRRSPSPELYRRKDRTRDIKDSANDGKHTARRHSSSASSSPEKDHRRSSNNSKFPEKNMRKKNQSRSRSPREKGRRKLEERTRNIEQGRRRESSSSRSASPASPQRKMKKQYNRSNRESSPSKKTERDTSSKSSVNIDKYQRSKSEKIRHRSRSVSPRRENLYDHSRSPSPKKDKQRGRSDNNSPRPLKSKKVRARSDSASPPYERSREPTPKYKKTRRDRSHSLSNSPVLAKKKHRDTRDSSSDYSPSSKSRSLKHESFRKAGRTRSRSRSRSRSPRRENIPEQYGDNGRSKKHKKSR